MLGQGHGHDFSSGRTAQLGFRFFAVWLFLAETLTSATLPLLGGN